MILCPLTATIDGAENGDLRMAKIFANNMVLQQQKPISVWGWAKPGDSVSVTITQQPQVGGPGMTTYQQQTKARVDTAEENDEYLSLIHI